MPDEAGPDGLEDLAALYDRLAPSLFRYALMILADRSGAEDAVQEVFTAMARRGTADVRSTDDYLRRAVRNACYRMLRQRSPDERARAAVDLEVVDAAGSRPEERLAVAQALRALPADQREVVHLKVFEGLTLQAIADATGESINTIASRYRYAMTKLRATLAERGAR
jgi:RNA polymerase sigma-70 factor (ECF subfamily)